MSTIENARAKVLLHPDLFRKDFYGWLADNFHVYLAFERESDRIRGRGREHYAHRTIWEYLRHETAIRETNGELKMNNNFTKDCALLYSLIHPEAKEFFSFKGDRTRNQMVEA